MLYEKKKIFIRRMIFIVLLVLGILTSITISVVRNIQSNNIEIIEDNGYINEYDTSLNKTSCEVEVVFNREVDSANISVAFYDSNDNLLATDNARFYPHGNTGSTTFYINGKVDSYEILSYSVSIDTYNPIPSYTYMYIIIIALPLFLSLCSHVKKYEYNENEIIVYAGLYHHYIKLNGKIVDEHNTFTYHIPISLSFTLEDGTLIIGTISGLNSISLKINNQLVKNVKI